MKTVPRWQVVGFAVVLLLLLAGGVLFYHAQEQSARHDAEEALQSIVQLKVNQIAQWRAERLADAEVLADSPLFAQGVAQWLNDPRPEASAPILTRFRALQKYYHYHDVLLVDPSGRVLLSLTGRTGRVHEDATQAIAAAVAGRRCILSDLHPGPGDLPSHLDAVVPLFGQDAHATKPIGAVLLQCNAREFLYPLVQLWPTPSRSAETLLVRKDGDAVLFLNDLRHQPDTALKLRVPLSRKDVPAVMAVEGMQGVVDGKDYRGVEVLSVLKAVPDSPWFMVAKVDATETLSAWRGRAFLIVAVILGFVLATAIGAAVVWQRNAKVHYRALYRSEEARRKSEERYRATLLGIGDGVIAADADGRVELLNPVAERLTGWQQEEARGKPIAEVFPIVNEETRKPVDNPVARVLSEGIVVGLANHTALIARDGAEYSIADSGAPIRDEQGQTTGVVLVFRDVTENRQLEEEREATIQMLKLLNARNSFHELMQSATSFLHAWTGCEAVGIRLREGDDFPYYETRGFPKEFVQAENSLCVTDLDGQCRRDEIGNPVLECMCGNILCGRFDPAKPFFTANGSFWTNCTTELLATTTEADRQGHTRNRCNTAGYESLALVPLRADGQTQGLLQFNDHRKGRFTSKSITLLERLADSLAIALAQRKAAAALRESEERHRTTLYSIGDAVITTDTAGRVRQMNHVAEALTGWRQEEAVGKPIAEVFHIVNEETRSEVENPVPRVLREGEIVGLANHTALISRDGTVRPIADSGAPIRDRTGNVLGVVLVFRDQSDERAAQEALQTERDNLQAVFAASPVGMLVIDDSEQVAHANPAAERMFGRKLAELQHIRCGDLIGCINRNEDPHGCGHSSSCHECLLLPAIRHALSANEGVHDQDTPVTLESDPEGTQRWLSFSVEPVTLGDRRHVVVALEDITERKRAGRQLAQSARQYRDLFENGGTGIIIVDRDGRYLLANKQSASAYGTTPEDVIGKSMFDFLQPDIAKKYLKANRSLMEAGGHREYVDTFRLPAGERTFLIVDQCLRDEDGRNYAIQSSSIDITESKKAEETLRQSEVRYRSLFDNMMNGLAGR